MTDAQINQFASQAADTAMRAAADYVRRNGLTVTDYDQATAALRQVVKARLGQALDDARDALDAHMGAAIAQATFDASMRLAGIEAAKQFAS